MIKETMANTKPNKHLYLKAIVANLDPVCASIEDYLYMANVFEATQEKLYFKLNQIQCDEYVWLTPEVLKKCKKRLLEVLEKEIMMGEPEMERTIIDCLDEEGNRRLHECLAPYFPANQQFQFTARVDLITEETLWELKCTSEITAEHMIQTVVYAWIMRTNDPMFSKKVKILNIRTGQVYELVAEKEKLDKIMVAILKGKYGEQPPFTDSEFLKECHKYIPCDSQNK